MRLRWSNAAQADVDRHWLFHADQNIDHADKVEARLQDRADALLVTPLMGRPIPGTDLRELSLPDIQYVIVYQPGSEEIMIVRVWSTSEDR